VRDQGRWRPAAGADRIGGFNIADGEIGRDTITNLGEDDNAG
jgi:hypothetical protein